MKKTIRINISGLIFNIDEDAFDKLQQYLNSITKKFINTEEGNEIIADVEARIAELFQERIGDRKEVINQFDVEHVTEVMGMPEDFEDEDLEEISTEEPNTKKTGRHIYRDTDNSVISGLAAGIANYFGIDPVIVRVLFVLMALFYGTSILIYILLWAIIPEAKTRSQKLEMKGQDINLSSIETSIKNEFSNVKSNFNKWQKSRNYNKIKENVGDIFNSAGKVFLVFAKIILAILGVSFFISGIAMLGTMTGTFFFHDSFLSPFSWTDVQFSIYDLATLFTDGFTARVAIIASYLLVTIPVLIVIYLSLKAIFRFRAKSRNLGVFAGALWLTSIFVLGAIAAKVSYGVHTDEEISQDYTISKSTSDTLYLKIKNTNNEYWSNEIENYGDVYLTYNDNKFELNGQPRLVITKSNTNITSLNVKKYSNGADTEEALNFAKNIYYDWQQDDTVLYFNRYFNIKGEKKIHDQKLTVTLEIPVGKTIYLDEDTDQITSYLDNIQHFSNYEMTEKHWIMTENGLSLLDEYKKDIKEDKEVFEEETKPTENKDKINDEIEAMKSELDSM